MDYSFRSGYRGQVAMANRKGKLFINPLSCKDYGHDALTFQFYPKYAKRSHQTNMGVTGEVNTDRPTFVLWTSAKTVERNARKFQSVINQLEEKLDIPKTVAYPVETGAGGKSAPFVAEADGWWLKSPVTVSAYFTLLRLTIAMRLNESFDDFIERIKKEKSKVHAINRDIGYIKTATENGNFAAFIEKTLPCMNREGYSDYLLSSHGRGLSGYHAKTDTYPLDEAGLDQKVAARYSDMKSFL